MTTPQGTIRLGALIATVLVLACGAEPAGSGAEREGSSARPDPVYARYERALALVERALSGTAGPDALRAAGGLALEAAGTKNAGAEYQGFHPDSLSPGAFRETLAFSPDGERIGHQYRHDRFDGTREAIREVYGPGDRRVIFILEQGFAVHLASPEHESARRRLARRLPGLLLAEVRERRAGLRHLGRSEGLEIVSAVLRDGRTVNLGFDPESGLLRRVGYLEDAPGFGDVVTRWSFDDYREVAGLGQVPHAYGVELQGRPFTRMAVAGIRTGAEAARDALDPPPGIEIPERQEIPSGADASAGAEVRKVAPGVYMAVRLRGGFHPMFVEFEEFVVAVDAPAGYPIWDELPASDVAPGPTSAWLTERFLELIRQTVPDKPVRYAVITHFHNDHAGGLRAFVAEGATLLVPPSAEAPVRRLVAAPHTLAPDRLARAGGMPRTGSWIQVVERRREVSDGRRTLEVLDVGPNPHTAHMLVVRLPEEDLWFVSDLLDPAPVESFPKPDHAALDRWFAGWLEREGHAPERIYTMHGTGLVTREHLATLGFRAPPKDEGETRESP